VRLHDLLGGVDVRERRGDLSVDVLAVGHDSRGAAPGTLFCCVPGRTSDGHDHAIDAVRAGAVALLVERFVDVAVAQVRVDSVRAAMGPVAAAFHGAPSHALRVVGVTGTNGKTTTTYLVDAIARAAGERTGLVGTVETRVGARVEPPGRTTPEAIELQALLATMRDEGVTTVSMEVSSHALDQHRVDATRFAAACFTNLTHEHLDYHGDLERYFEAKARLFDPAFTSNAAVNVDDEHGRRLVGIAGARGLSVTTWSATGPADVCARDVRLGAEGTELTLDAGGTTATLRTTLLGPFNVANAVGAAATARAAGLPDDAVVAGLAAPVVVPGRLERVGRGGPTVLVDYAHTPDALARALAAVRELTAPEGRVVVVFGCGGDRDRAKRPLMGEVAGRLADRVVVTSDNPRSESPEAIAGEVVRGVPHGTDVVTDLDRRQAIRRALAAAHPGDVVLVAGKGHETGQTAGGVTRPFDDRVVVREELEALGCG
jgi:UDP-N-acetylmuramoyl-L-alanyl-D-glutamate--2,6-diaminopimelate ligase